MHSSGQQEHVGGATARGAGGHQGSTPGSSGGAIGREVGDESSLSDGDGGAALERISQGQAGEVCPEPAASRGEGSSSALLARR